MNGAGDDRGEAAARELRASRPRRYTRFVLDVLRGYSWGRHLATDPVGREEKEKSSDERR